MSCVICMAMMEEHEFADHVRVLHPEDAREVFEVLGIPEPRGESAFAA